MLLRSDTVSTAEFEEGTGWELKPEGACRGEVCVPLPDDARPRPGVVDVRTVAPRLGMPIVEDPRHELAALGPATVVGRALESAVAPELELPDADGNPFRLSSLHGKKVLLVAWASW